LRFAPPHREGRHRFRITSAHATGEKTSFVQGKIRVYRKGRGRSEQGHDRPAGAASTVAEESMLAPPHAQIWLAPRALHRILDGEGLILLCLKGAVWVTQEDDARDIILTAGESFTLDRKGLAVLYALSAACMAIQSHAIPSLPARAA
jgi:hypothetical protein